VRTEALDDNQSIASRSSGERIFMELFATFMCAIPIHGVEMVHSETFEIFNCLEWNFDTGMLRTVHLGYFTGC